jgi:predicted amidohydrolase YtcJ
MTSRLIRKREILRAALLGFGACAMALPALAADNPGATERLVITNGRIHTMDANDTVLNEVHIKNGRFVRPGIERDEKVRVIDVGGRTVIPGIIDGHNHIVLVGNRPGWNTPMEHVFSIPDAIAEYKKRAAQVPAGEFITTIGTVAAMQFAEQRLPNLTELDAIPRPVYIQANQGGTRTNTLGKDWLTARGIVVNADGSIGGGNTGSTGALLLLRQQLLTPATRQRSSADALNYYNTLGITTHRDAGAFQSDLPSGGIANENTYTMYNPFLALQRAKVMPARLRFEYLHQDPATDPTIPTLTARLKNAHQRFGDDWMRSDGIGEFTGGGVTGLKAIAAAGWRAEDHTLNLASFNQLVADREAANAEVPINGLRWVIAHVPQVSEAGVNSFKAMGGGLLVGWGPTRTRAAGAAAVGPVYRWLFDNGIPLGYHSDGGDITSISPWLNFYTMITGKNLRGDNINDNQVLTRRETLWLATAANKWITWEDDLGSIETGNHADLVVLDKDYFSVPDAQIPTIHSVLTLIEGQVKYDGGVLRIPPRARD